MAKYTYLLGQKFKSNYGDEFEVIEEIKKVREGSKRGSIRYEYKIRFIVTGFETVTRPDNIIDGRVKDWSKSHMYQVVHMYESAGIFISNTGSRFRVVTAPKKSDSWGENWKRPGINTAMVMFIDTGRTEEFRVDSISNKAVFDRYNPSVAGVGFMGDISISKDDEYNRRVYDCWRNMIKRCYDKSREDYNRYGGYGTTVHKDWHCFKTFYDDVQRLEGFNMDKFMNSEIQLDKDKRNFCSDEREYSKENCQWLTKDENYRFRRPRRGRANT